MDERLYSQASCVSGPCRVPFSRPEPRRDSEPNPSAPAGPELTRSPNGLLKGRPTEQRPSSRHSVQTAPPPEAPEQAKRDKTSPFPMSTSPQPKPTSGYPHDKSIRIPSRHPRPDSPLPNSTVNGNNPDVKSASPGSASRFGCQFPRNRPPLPDYEPDTSSPERSPSPAHRSTSRTVVSGIPSHIVPKVAIKRSGDGQTFTKSHKREFSEANGAVPPNIHLPGPEFASETESMDTPSLRGSDGNIMDAPTPIARPIEIPPPEKLQSLSPIHTASAAEDPDSDASSPPAAAHDRFRFLRLPS